MARCCPTHSYLTGVIVPFGSGPLHRGIVNLASGFRPGSRRSPAVSNASSPRPKPVPAGVSPEDPPRSKPGLSIPWPRSLAVGDSTRAGFFGTDLTIPSVAADDTDEVDSFSLFFMRLILRIFPGSRLSAPSGHGTGKPLALGREKILDATVIPRTVNHVCGPWTDPDQDSLPDTGEVRLLRPASLRP